MSDAERRAAFAVTRVRELPHGVLAYVPLDGIGRELDAATFDALPIGLLAPEERALARTLAPRRAPTWIGGRVALRRALLEAGAVDVPPLLATDRGAPTAAPGFRGSISHKETLAVALAARDDGAHVGVDLELDVPRRAGVERHVLTEAERARVRSPGDVVLAFAIKEAIYKAIDPFVRRYVSFHEVELTLEPAGAIVAPHLRDEDGPLQIEVWWAREDGLVLATARARRGSTDGHPA